MDEQADIFNALSWPPDSVALSLESGQVPAPSQVTPSTNTTAELPSLLTLLLPMMNGVETATMPSAPVSCQPKPTAIVFSSNNGVIDDPLIQSLAAEQAASAHNYDLLSHRHKRVSHRSSTSSAFTHIRLNRFDVLCATAISQRVRPTFNCYWVRSHHPS